MLAPKRLKRSQTAAFRLWISGVYPRSLVVRTFKCPADLHSCRWRLISCAPDRKILATPPSRVVGLPLSKNQATGKHKKCVIGWWDSGEQATPAPKIKDAQCS